MENFEKIKIVLSLCLALGSGSLSFGAVDTPVQAAARAALMERLNQPDAPQIQPPPTTNTPAVAATEPPAQGAPNVTETIADRTMTPQTDAPATVPMAAQAAVPASKPVAAAANPVAASPAVITPAITRPAAAAPAISPVTLLFVLIGLLLIALTVMLILLLKLRALKQMLLKNPTVMARAAEAYRHRGAK